MGKTAIVFTCSHADPRVNNNRFSWLGELIFDIKPDYVVDLGDGADMRSLNTYDSRYPEAVAMQSYEQDINYYNDAQERLRWKFRLQKKRRPAWFGFEGNHECFQGHTEIFTKKDGWKYVTDIKVGDQVIDKDGQWQKVEVVHEFDHNGPMYSYVSQTGEFTVTPNHRVYYYGSNGKLHIKPAKDTPKELDLPVAASLKEGSLTYLSDAQVKLCAVALTDSYHKNNKVVFYQSGEKAKVIEQILVDNCIDYKKVERNRAPKEICGRLLKSTQTAYEFHFTRPSFSPDQNMRIPNWLFNLPDNQAQIFLDTLIFCDGSTFSDRDSRIFYGKKQICDDVQAFCQLHGHRASITEYRPNQFRVNINPRSKQRFKKVKTKDIEDKVYCITVKSGNFLARQGGVSLFTGNCRIKKAIQLDPRLEGTNYGISFRHLQTDQWFTEYHEYSNGAPAIYNYDGIDYAHYISAGNYGTAMSGEHHAFNLLKKRMRSTTVGHSHKRNIYFRDDAKAIGLVAGCYKGAPEGWAGQANDEWWSGIIIKRDLDNGYYEPEFVSYKRLREAYGN